MPDYDASTCGERIADVYDRSSWRSRSKGGWGREPFTAQSPAHVSVYARAG